MIKVSRLKFTPLEFETHKRIGNDKSIKVKIYSVGV